MVVIVVFSDESPDGPSKILSNIPFVKISGFFSFSKNKIKILPSLSKATLVFIKKLNAVALLAKIRLSSSSIMSRYGSFSNDSKPEYINSPQTGNSLPKKKLKRSEEHTSELQSRFDLVCR